jgi:hypothetical protein
MSSLEARAFARKGNTLVPVDVHADEWLKGLPEGKEVLVRGWRARSPQHHRWFFALLAKVVDNTDKFTDVEELLDAIKLRVGHYQKRVQLNGTEYLYPKSIDFASMDQEAFKRFVNRALWAVQTDLGIDGEALMTEVDQEQGNPLPWRRHNGGPAIADSPSDAAAPAPEKAAVSEPHPIPMETAATSQTASERPATHAAEVVPEDAAGGIIASPAKAVPPETAGAPAAVRPLSSGDRATVGRYAAALAEALEERALQRGSGAFIEDHGIAEGTAIYEACREIFRAHLARVNGTSSPVEAEQAVERVLAA